MKQFIKKLLRESLFDDEDDYIEAEGPQIFMRKTISPQNDLIRNFSCYADAWFNTREEAERYEEADSGSFSQGIKQDPVTKKWCGYSEDGLSAYIVTNEEQYTQNMKELNDYPHLKNITKIAIFRSDDYYLESGSDAEDTFRGGEFLFYILPTTTYEEFMSKLNSLK